MFVTMIKKIDWSSPISIPFISQWMYLNSRPLFVHGQTEQPNVAFFIYLSHLNMNIAASDSSTILSEQSHIRDFSICIFQNFVQTRFKNHQKRKIINLNLHPKTIKLYVPTLTNITENFVQLVPSLRVNPQSWFGPKRNTKFAFNNTHHLPHKLLVHFQVYR